jgi:hypothetical protein
MKIIEQAGLAHRRSRRTCGGSDRNVAACPAMNVSREFPPYARCHCISVRSLDPPPGLRAAICREEIVRHGRSGRRDRIDEIYCNNGLADNGEPAASPADRRAGIIDIRDFDECHKFFETFNPLPGA